MSDWYDKYYKVYYSVVWDSIVEKWNSVNAKWDNSEQLIRLEWYEEND